MGGLRGGSLGLGEPLLVGVVVGEDGLFMVGLLISGVVSRMEVGSAEHYGTGKYLFPDTCSCG